MTTERGKEIVERIVLAIIIISVIGLIINFLSPIQKQPAPIDKTHREGLRPAECEDRIDNDQDGLIDAEDPDCSFNPAEDTPLTENCEDGLDNDGDGFIDFDDPDCIINPQENCEFCNDENVFVTCDISLVQQSTHTSIDLSQFGMNKNGISIGGSFFAAGEQYSYEEAVSKTREEIYQALSSYLETQELNETGLVIIDIEATLGTVKWQDYIHDPEELHRIYDAIKLRIDVARELLPEAKLTLFNTPYGVGARSNPPNEDFLEHLQVLREAGEYGVFDDLDYLLPNVYTRYSGNLNSNVRYTNNTLRYALEIKNSSFDSFKIIPLLSAHIAGTGGPDQNADMAPPETVFAQIRVIQTEHPETKSIAFWVGDDNYNEIDYVQFFRDVKPVPRACFD